MGKGNFYTLLGFVKYSHWRKQNGISKKKIKTKIFYLAMPLLGHGNTYTTMFIAALFTIVRKWGQPMYL